MTLKPCETYELNKVNTIADYMAVANSTESLEKVEECMRVWIKQIEQVGGWDCFLYCRKGIFGEHFYFTNCQQIHVCKYVCMCRKLSLL